MIFLYQIEWDYVTYTIWIMPLISHADYHNKFELLSE